MARPRTTPKLRRGEGSLWWDDQRGHCVLDHLVDRKRCRHRGDSSWQSVLLARDECLADRAEAVELAAELADGGRTTLPMLLERWLEHGVEGAPQTIAQYRNSARILCAELGDVRLVDLRLGELNRLFEDLTARPSLGRRRPLGKGSLVKVRSHLGMALDYAMAQEWTTANVARSIMIPKSAAKARNPKYLDRDGYRAMREYLVEHRSTVHTLLLASLLTGLRPGEAAGLRWSNVDLDGATLAVRSALQVQSNRRRRVVDELKVPTAKRRLELTADLVAALRAEHRAQAERRLVAASWPEPTLVFTTRTGTALDPANLRRAVRDACDCLELDGIDVKGLRHTFASVALDAGLPMPAVARAMGHVDARMVATTYGHALDDVVPTAAALDRLVAG
jgi:integrase